MRLSIAAFLLMLLLLFVVFTEKETKTWSGADTLAKQKIVEITGGEYKPWFSPIWKPPSSEIETFLFSLQAAAGAVVIGYFVGYFRGIKEGMRRAEAR
jgi:cobalt/nickel transport protein